MRVFRSVVRPGRSINVILVVDIVLLGHDGTVGIHEGGIGIGHGFGRGLVGDDAGVGAVIVAQGGVPFVIRGQHEGMEWEALGVGTDEDDVSCLQILHAGDLLEAHLLAPLEEVGDYLTLLQGLIRKACAVEDPIHETVTTGAERTVVDGGVGGGIAVGEFRLAGVDGDVVALAEKVALEEGIGDIHHLTLLVGHTVAVLLHTVAPLNGGLQRGIRLARHVPLGSVEAILVEADVVALLHGGNRGRLALVGGDEGLDLGAVGAEGDLLQEELITCRNKVGVVQAEAVVEFGRPALRILGGFKDHVLRNSFSEEFRITSIDLGQRIARLGTGSVLGSVEHLKSTTPLGLNLEYDHPLLLRGKRNVAFAAFDGRVTGGLIHAVNVPRYARVTGFVAGYEFHAVSTKLRIGRRSATEGGVEKLTRKGGQIDTSRIGDEVGGFGFRLSFGLGFGNLGGNRDGIGGRGRLRIVSIRDGGLGITPHRHDQRKPQYHGYKENPFFHSSITSFCR